MEITGGMIPLYSLGLFPGYLRGSDISSAAVGTYLVAVAGLAVAVILLAAVVFRFWRAARASQRAIDETQEIRRRLEGALRLNRGLIEVQDENDLMEKFLSIVAWVVGSSYASFVPMDEMEQPLPAFVHGELPEPILKAWSDHLVSQMVKQRCKVCQGINRDTSRVCPLLQGFFAEDFDIYCLPLKVDQKLMGVLNIYLASGKNLSDELCSYLEGLIAEVGIAIDGIRRRNQEIATLRQLRKIRSLHTDFRELFYEIIKSLWVSAGTENVTLYLKANEIVPETVFLTGSEISLSSDVAEKIIVQFPAAEKTHGFSDVAIGGKEKAYVARPILFSDNTACGVMIVPGLRKETMTLNQLAALNGACSQIELLLENERGNLGLEYRIILEERMRLAREIHDGLAQTLAFLKMQTAQMMNQLNQGDNQRLAARLRQNYTTISEAYIDVREAIDNLRLTPIENMSQWIKDIALEYQVTIGIPIRVDIAPESMPFSNEIQAQMVRIIQEALSNIRKHSLAHNAWIRLYRWEEDYLLEIGDDGIGIAPDDVLEVSRHGLRGMRERAELIGADFQIISSPENGTTVRLRLPGIEGTLV